MRLLFWRKSPPFQKIIRHKDWLIIGNEPAIFIPRSEHKKGKRPLVMIKAPENTVQYEFLDKGILIKRGLPIYKGTPFMATVTIR
jgi:hypothetical protein